MKNLKKHFKLIIRLCLLLIAVVAVAFFRGDILMRNNSPVVSSDWEGTWIMDRVYDDFKLHNVLTISQVGANSFEFDLEYQEVSGGYEGHPSEVVTGHESSEYFHGDLEVSAQEVTMTYRFNTGEKNVVSTFVLSNDKKSIVFDMDTCPEMPSFTPDGCKVLQYTGRYIRQ